MSWKDRAKLPATFRKVPFFVDTSDRGGGRRNVKHEYPKKDLPFSEDMGRQARTFQIEGYVIGDGYFTARDALIGALEAEGSGELVHPYHGTLRVVVDSFRVRETLQDGGMAFFSVDLSETTAEPTQPATVPDANSALGNSVRNAKQANSDGFLSKYNAQLDAASNNSITGQLRSATLKINNVVARVDMEKQKLANLKRRVQLFEAAISSLVRTPADIVQSVSEMFDLFDTSWVMQAIYAYLPGTRPLSTTPTRAREQQNWDATYRMIQRFAVLRAAEIVAVKTFASYEEAIAGRVEITDLLDEQAEVAADDAYPQLLQVRSDIVKAVPGSDHELAHLVSHTPAVTVPSLVLAHRLYGNLDREADLLARNHVEHPGFVVGGSALEVLSGG